MELSIECTNPLFDYSLYEFIFAGFAVRLEIMRTCSWKYFENALISI